MDLERLVLICKDNLSLIVSYIESYSGALGQGLELEDGGHETASSVLMEPTLPKVK